MTRVNHILLSLATNGQDGNALICSERQSLKAIYGWIILKEFACYGILEKWCK